MQNKLESQKRTEEAIRAIQAGKMVIMMDDEHRENEGDLVFAATDVCPQKINFMATHGKGLICLALSPKQAKQLNLSPVLSSQHARKSTAFTNSIEAKVGVTTGISAADRAQTIRVATDDHSTPDDLVTPGHVFPLVARPGGVLERTGHTEGSIDLVKLAHKKPTAVICEIMNNDGTMARRDDLEKFSKEFEIPIVTVADIVSYRLEIDKLVSKKEESSFVLKNKTFYFYEVLSDIDRQIHFAISTHRHFDPDCVVDVRVHRQSSKSDFLDTFCESGPFSAGVQTIKESEFGVFIYMKQMIENQAYSTPVFREYGIGAQILKSFGIQKMKLHTSSNLKLSSLEGFGLEISNRIQLEK